MFRVTLNWISLVVALALAPMALAGPIENLQPGHWYEVPNSHLRSVVPSPEPPGATGAASIMIAWSGGVYDTKRDRLIVWGGGHSDYGGNEVYAFNINSLTWSRIWGPSTNIPDPLPQSCSSTYSDGNPCSRHTYDGLAYLPVQDKFWITSGSDYCGPGGASTDAFTFNFSNSTWSRGADPPWGYLEIASDFDPVTGHVFMAAPASNKDLTEYNPATDSYSLVGDCGNIGACVWGYQTAVIDPVRRKYVAVGGSHDPIVYNLASSHPIQAVTQSTSGDQAMRGTHYPGLVFDPVSDRVVAWSGGPDVYTLNTATWVWTKFPPAPTNTVTPTQAPGQGTYGRWQYIPSKNAFIAVNSIDENVFIYKLSPGGGAPPDSVDPGRTNDLRTR